VLFLDEPTAGVDVELRRDMWQMVRGLQQRGVTIILTTHYIEEAEEMAERIGVIRRGEIILVEDKARLMQRFSRKQLTLQLQRPLPALPAELAEWPLELAADGLALVHRFDTARGPQHVGELLRRLAALGIEFKDLQTEQSSLEDIFVSLVHKT
jgi:ABC-2 type transport system ATP-binding protein